MKACPYRQVFYAKLAFDPEQKDVPLAPERLNSDLDKWLDSLSKIIKILQDFYAEGGYGKGL